MAIDLCSSSNLSLTQEPISIPHKSYVKIPSELLPRRHIGSGFYGCLGLWYTCPIETRPPCPGIFIKEKVITGLQLNKPNSGFLQPLPQIPENIQTLCTYVAEGDHLGERARNAKLEYVASVPHPLLTHSSKPEQINQRRENAHSDFDKCLEVLERAAKNNQGQDGGAQESR